MVRVVDKKLVERGAAVHLPAWGSGGPEFLRGVAAPDGDQAVRTDERAAEGEGSQPEECVGCNASAQIVVQGQSARESVRVGQQPGQVRGLQVMNDVVRDHDVETAAFADQFRTCLLYTSPSPRDS